MQGQVVVISKNQGRGRVFGITLIPKRASCGSFPVAGREVAIRLLDPGQKVEFITTRTGEAQLISPLPRIGCRGSKESAC